MADTGTPPPPRKPTPLATINPASRQSAASVARIAPAPTGKNPHFNAGL